VEESDLHMIRDWNARASTQLGAMSAIIDGYTGPSPAFYQLGKRHVEDMLLGLEAAGVEISPAVLAHKRIVEVGCGIGRLTLWLANVFGYVAATDIAENMIRRCPALPNVDYYATPSLEIVRGGPYDMLVSLIVFQHMPKAIFWRYLAESYGLLRRGGIFHTQLHESDVPIEHAPSETLLVRGYTKQELRAGIDPEKWKILSLLAPAGKSETWKWLTLEKLS
jgi:2-polyprenyl-3-methyl-5-hydroxy-6-metoxy-1,4-benzoquinol methylase